MNALAILTQFAPLAAAALAQATNTPVPDQGPDPDSVTPGTLGFIVTALVVIVSIFLINDAVRRARRVRAKDGAVDIAPLPIRPDGAPSDWQPPAEPSENAAEDKKLRADKPEGR